MESKTKKIALALAIAATAVGGSVALASKYDRDHYGHGKYWHEEHGSHHGEHIADWLDDKIDLTEEQHDRIELLGKKFHDRVKAERRPVRDKAAALIRSSSLTAEDVEAIIEARRSGREATRRALAESISEAHALLTPEQRRKLANLVAEGYFVGGRGGRHGGHRGWRNHF